MRIRYLSIAVCIGYSLTQGVLKAQVEGAISGTVKDASDAVIVNAAVVPSAFARHFVLLGHVVKLKPAPCEEPSALAIDRANGKLFAGCANKKLAVIDIASGKVLTTFPIGPHVDALAFDPETKLIFASTYDGKVSVVHQDSADKYSQVDTLVTKQASKTMDIDLKTHNLWIPAASFQPPLKADAIRTPPGTMPAAGTFEVMVYSK